MAVGRIAHPANRIIEQNGARRVSNHNPVHMTLHQGNVGQQPARWRRTPDQRAESPCRINSGENAVTPAGGGKRAAVESHRRETAEHWLLCTRPLLLRGNAGSIV